MGWILVVLVILGASAQGQSSVNLAWDSSAGSSVAGYRVYTGAASHIYTNAITVGNVTNRTITGLTGGITYFFAVTAYATNGMESAYSGEISFTVPATNNPPTVALTSPSNGASFTAPAAINLAASVTANGHTITKVQFYNGAILLGEDASAPFTFNWSNVGAGSYALTARTVYDAGSTVASSSANVTVLAVNTAPTISDIIGRSINEDANTGAIAFTVGDGETAAGSLIVSGGSSNPTLVSAGNIVFGGSGASRTVTVTPTANQSGTATITVSVSDGLLTASDSFVLTVNAVNDAPTIGNIANQSTAVSTAVGPINFTIGDVETAVASLTVNGSSANTVLVPNGNIVFGGGGASRTVTVTPAAGQTGTATITVTVSDGALTVSSAFVLTVNVQPTGLVAAYGFAEGTGTTAADASSSAVTGTINGATWTTAGKYGNALSFNGTSSYVDPGNPAALQITGSMTWSAWVKAAGNPTDDGQIVAKSDGSSGWQLKTSPDTGPHTFGVKVSGSAGSSAQRYSTTVRSLNVWYHVAGVYNAAARTLDIYVNGVLNNGTLVGTIPASQVTAPVNVNIGRRTGGFYFNGIIDEVRVYNRALSAAEIQSDMNTLVGGNPPPNTVPTISDIIDRTINEDANIGPVAFTVGDAETAPGSLILSGTSSNPTLVPNGNIVFGGSGANRTVTITPAAGQTGTATITVGVSDGTNSVSDTFVLTVNAVNAPPTVALTSPSNGASFTAPAAINLAASVTANGHTITKVQFYNGATLLGEDASTPFTFNWSNVSAGSYALTSRAVYDSGSTVASSTVNINVTGLPAPWQAADIGIVGAVGSASVSDAFYTVQGAGNISGTADNFRFVYQPLSGDGEIRARLNSLDNTGTSARIGVMIRESLTSGSEYAFMGIPPGGTFRWQRRSTTGGATSSTTSTIGTPPNVWLRLLRVGNVLTGYRSTDGTNWTQISSRSITMATNIYVGLAVASGSSNTLNTAAFSGVTVVP